MNKVIVFDVGSFFGYFRKSYTTTFGLTYSVIPRSTTEGLIAAILGLDSQKYPDLLINAKIAVQLLGRVRKINMKIMHTNPDWWKADLNAYLTNTTAKSKLSRVPASAEFLLEPHYRIYVDSKQIHDSLLDLLGKKQSYYTPYLGSSSMICFLHFVGEYSYKSHTLSKYAPVKSIIPFNEIPDIKIQSNQSFAIEDSIPLHIDSSRKPYGTYNIVYNPTGNMLDVQEITTAQLNDGEKTNIAFLPTSI